MKILIHNFIFQRWVCNAILFCAIFYLPWWIVAPLALINLYIFPHYYEIFLGGILFDTLYGAYIFPFGGMMGIFFAIGSLILVNYMRQVVR